MGIPGSSSNSVRWKFIKRRKGGVTGTIFAVLLIQIIKNGLNVIGVQSIMQNAIIGSIVLAAIIIDAVVRIRAKE